MNRREALAALTALPGMTRISKADLKPSDVIVVECDRYPGLEAIDRIRTQLQDVWPNHKILITSDMRLKVVSGS